MSADTWGVETTSRFDRDVRKLDPQVRKRVFATLVAAARSGDPRSRGKGLSHDRVGLWWYRVGDWRIIVDLQDDRMVILALEAGPRSTIYTR